MAMYLPRWQHKTYATALKRHLRPQARVVVNMIASRQRPVSHCLLLRMRRMLLYWGRGVSVMSGRDGWDYTNVVATYGSDTAHQPAPFASQPPYHDDYAPLERLRQECREVSERNARS